MQFGPPSGLLLRFRGCPTATPGLHVCASAQWQVGELRIRARESSEIILVGVPIEFDAAGVMARPYLIAPVLAPGE